MLASRSLSISLRPRILAWRSPRSKCWCRDHSQSHFINGFVIACHAYHHPTINTATTTKATEARLVFLSKAGSSSGVTSVIPGASPGLGPPYQRQVKLSKAGAADGGNNCDPSVVLHPTCCRTSAPCHTDWLRPNRQVYRGQLLTGSHASGGERSQDRPAWGCRWQGPQVQEVLVRQGQEGQKEGACDLGLRLLPAGVHCHCAHPPAQLDIRYGSGVGGGSGREFQLQNRFFTPCVFIIGGTGDEDGVLTIGGI